MVNGISLWLPPASYPLVMHMVKHIVTVEGINIDGLNYVQQAFTDERASPMWFFCTPGFMMSLAGFVTTANANAGKRD